MRKEILENLVESISNVFGSNNVIFDKINIDNVGQEKCSNNTCLITVNQTTFNQKQGNGNLYIPELDLELVTFIKEGSTPLLDAIEKEDELIAELLKDPTRGGFAADTVLNVSTATNNIVRYQNFGSVSSVLRVRIEYSLSY